MTTMKTVIVTGANRGIGRAICDLVLGHPTTTQSSAPVILYATSRSGEDLGINPPNSKDKVLYHSLDIGKQGSVSDFLDTVKSNGHLPISILINNAGVNLDDNFNPDNARKTLDINYRGTLALCQAVLPHMGTDGSARVVNLSSVGSSLNPYSKEKANQFRSIEDLKDLESFMNEYLGAVDKDAMGSNGWPQSKAYSVSKGCVNSFTKILAMQNPKVSINCCCPGWVDTDMGNMLGKPPKSLEDGAKIPVRLALGNIDNVTGRYWADDSPMDKGESHVQEW